MGTTTKTIKKRNYLYFTYYDPNTKSKKEVYCGLTDDPNSTNKALQLESSRLKEQKKIINYKIDEIENRLAKKGKNTAYSDNIKN